MPHQEEAAAIAFFDIWASRRRAAKDLFGGLAEAMEVSDKVLRVDVPFETDEEYSADFNEAKDFVAKLKKNKFMRKLPQPPAAGVPAAGEVPPIAQGGTVRQG